MKHTLLIFLLAIAMATLSVSGQDAPGNNAVISGSDAAHKQAAQVVKVAETYLEQTSAEVTELRDAVQKMTGLASSSGYPKLVSDLQEQRETLLEEEAAAKGRRAGLEDAIARLDKQTTTRAGDDPVFKELQAVVKARQTKLDRLKQMQQAAAVAQSEVDEAVAELALSRANAAAAQQRLTSGANDALEVWNRELMNLNIAAEERAARLKYIETRLNSLEGATSAVDQLESARDRMHQAEAALNEARQGYNGVLFGHSSRQ
jgi:chromosome segregation ATPase